MDSIHPSIHGVSDQPAATEAMQRAESVLSDTTLADILALNPSSEIPVARQVFVNRNLHMAKVAMIGFDMDYTLAIYHQRRIEHLSYDMTVDRLITHCGYAEEIRTISYDYGSVIRGLFVDKVNGNLLKIDRFGHVGRAFHGVTQLSDEELQRLYRNERIRLKNTEYAWVDTLFALPEAALFAGMVDLYENKRKEKIDYTKLYDDIRASIDTVHRDNTLKAVLRARLSHYVYKDAELAAALHKLRSGGKKLFVLTNSAWDYTKAVMEYLLDGALPEYPSWRNYFDVVITSAAKPAFFSEQRPFEEMDGTKAENVVIRPAKSLERGKVYQGGNLADFERMTGYQGESVLYVGDHIYGDILKSKKTSMWRTCMIVQEIEDEISYLESRRPEIDKLSQLELLQMRIDDEVGRHKSRLNAIERKQSKGGFSPEEAVSLEAEFKAVKTELDRLRKALKECTAVTHTLEGDIDAGFNARWGLHFKEGPENSRFGEQVEQYACLYTSRVSNFVFYSPIHFYRSPRDLMPHEQAGALSFKMNSIGGEGLPRAANRAPTEIP